MGKSKKKTPHGSNPFSGDRSLPWDRGIVQVDGKEWVGFPFGININKRLAVRKCFIAGEKKGSRKVAKSAKGKKSEINSKFKTGSCIKCGMIKKSAGWQKRVRIDAPMGGNHSVYGNFLAHLNVFQVLWCGCIKNHNYSVGILSWQFFIKTFSVLFKQIHIFWNLSKVYWKSWQICVYW